MSVFFALVKEAFLNNSELTSATTMPTVKLPTKMVRNWPTARPQDFTETVLPLKETRVL